VSHTWLRLFQSCHRYPTHLKLRSSSVPHLAATVPVMPQVSYSPRTKKLMCPTPGCNSSCHATGILLTENLGAQLSHTWLHWFRSCHRYPAHLELRSLSVPNLAAMVPVMPQVSYSPRTEGLKRPTPGCDGSGHGTGILLTLN